VLSVDLRATELQMADGRIVLIPNAEVYTSALTNYSREARRRLDLSVGIAPGSDLERVRAMALETARSIPGILTDPAPQAFFSHLDASAIDFSLYYWVDSRESDLLAVKDAILVAIESAFAKEGIAMAASIPMLVKR